MTTSAVNSKLSIRTKIFYSIDLDKHSWAGPLRIDCRLSEQAPPQLPPAPTPPVTMPFVSLLEQAELHEALGFALRTPKQADAPAYVQIDRSQRHRRLVEMLAQTRRLYLCWQAADDGMRTFQRLQAPLIAAQLRCNITYIPAAQSYTLSLQVHTAPDGDWQDLSWQPPASLLAAGYMLLPGKLLDFAEPFSKPLLSLLAHTTADALLSCSKLERLLQALSSDEHNRYIQVNGLQPQSEALATGPVPVLQLSRHGVWQPQHRFCAQLWFDYGGQRQNGALENQYVINFGNGSYAPRCFEREQQLLAELKSKGFFFRDILFQKNDYIAMTPRLLPVLPEMLAAGWQIEALGQPMRRIITYEVKINAADSNWFELETCLVYDGNNHVNLPAAIAQIRAGNTLYQLRDGSFALLPTVTLERYARLYELGEAARKKNKVRFARSQAMLLQALAEFDDVTFSADDAYGKVRAALATEVVTPAMVQPGADFHATLRHYQQEAVAWLLNLHSLGFGGCLADDMGLGKTVTTLALLEHLRGAAALRGPALVVAPRSILENWRREAARFAPQLRLCVHHGPERTTTPAELVDHDLIITTYGMLRRDVALLAKLKPDICILDEAQVIKNPQSQAAKAACSLGAAWRVALTGTPVENHLGDLWSLFEFLNPGLLGSGRRFARFLENPQQTPGDTTLELIGRALRPFLLRRTKQQVLTELPPKTETILYCELGERQRLEYNMFLAAARSRLLDIIDDQGLSKSKLKNIEILLRLRQCACHPGLVFPELVGLDSAKLEVLVESLREIGGEGHKALVFSQFTSFLRLAAQRLDAEGIAYEYLDGRTTDRQQRVDRFQSDSQCPVFLISLKAGGLGLNLTAADYVYILDPWWNPAAEAQAMDRAHRMGQQQPVMVYRLIAPDTVEEKVLLLQQRKRGLAEAVLNSHNAFVKNLDLADLELLLS